jgi:hypothetical protein
MAKTFYWDSTGSAEATLTDGTFSTADWTAGASITNESYLNDQSVGSAATAIVANDGIMFDCGSSVTPSICAIYVASGTGDITCYQDSDSNDDTKTSAGTTTVSSTGWNIISLSGSARYWFVKFEDTFTISEIFFGKSFVFPVGYELGNTSGANYGVDVTESYGGIEAANKRHGAKNTWNWTWQYLNETAKDNLITMREDLDMSFLKFIYYDDTTYNWVRLVGGLEFSEVAYQAYNTSISLIGQLE